MYCIYILFLMVRSLKTNLKKNNCLCKSYAATPSPSKPINMSLQALPIECKMNITSYLFPFVKPNPKWDRFVDSNTLVADYLLLSKIDDTDINAIVKNGPNLCKKEYNEYLNIGVAKTLHRLAFVYDIDASIKENRISSTCSNGACYVCKAEMPYAWPSTTSVRHLLAGTCSKNCFKEYRNSALYRRICSDNAEYKCKCCRAVIHPEDIDDINDEDVYCSYKCRGLDNYKKSDDCQEDLYEAYKEQARQY
jgi:hypothetical protein